MAAAKFDTAADDYDAVRGFPLGVGQQVAQVVADWAGAGARVLELGVGTGRIARPMAALGLRVAGIDRSRQMLARAWQGLAATNPRPEIIQGDLLALPLAAEQFQVVLAVHVFHLIADWTGALTQVRRVLRPGGVFLSGFEWRPPDSPGARLTDRWRAILRAAGQPALAAGGRDYDDLRAELVRLGAVYQERSVGEWTTVRTLARHLETIEHRTWTPGLGLSPDDYANALAELRAWAMQTFGPLDREFSVPHRFIWQRFGWE